MDSGYADRLREKQETSFARRLWIIMIIYEKTLDGDNTDSDYLMDKLSLSKEEVRTECNILRTSGLIKWDHTDDEGVPYGIELTGTALIKIENAPVEHYDILESDARDMQKQGSNIMIKQLEIERLKQETKLKKMGSISQYYWDRKKCIEMVWNYFWRTLIIYKIHYEYKIQLNFEP